MTDRELLRDIEEMAEVVDREHPAYNAAMAAAAGAVGRHVLAKAPVIGYTFRAEMRQDMLAAGDPFGLADCRSLQCPVCGRNLVSVRDAKGPRGHETARVLGGRYCRGCGQLIDWDSI